MPLLIAPSHSRGSSYLRDGSSHCPHRIGMRSPSYPPRQAYRAKFTGSGIPWGFLSKPNVLSWARDWQEAQRDGRTERPETFGLGGSTPSSDAAQYLLFLPQFWPNKPRGVGPASRLRQDGSSGRGEDSKQRKRVKCFYLLGMHKVCPSRMWKMLRYVPRFSRQEDLHTTSFSGICGAIQVAYFPVHM